MQADQTGICKYVNSRSGKSKDGRSFYNFSVADEKNEIFTFYCVYDVYEKIKDLKFGDELQLVFSIQQWRSGLNINVSDVIKKN